MRQTLLLALLGVVGLGVGASAQEPPVAYPWGYREWTHVKSMVIQPGHPLYASFGGIHHIYANRQALQTYRSGRGPFPDGAILVFDLLEAVTGENTITEGHRKVVGVMQKDHQRFKETGGWGFEAFAAGDPSRPVVGRTAATACFSCHASQKDHDFVFSSWRE